VAREPFDESAPAFGDRLREPAMAALFADWCAMRREAGGLPRYRQFDPFRFPQMMPSLQVLERDPDGRYFQRLAGARVVEKLGVDNKGRFLDQIVEPAHFEERRGHLERVLDTGLPAAARGFLSRPTALSGAFKRLMLPFARDDGLAGLVVSAIAYARSYELHDLKPGDPIQTLWARLEDVL
jgi:hypothetical protein